MGRAAPFFASLRPCPLGVETNTPSHFQARMVDNRGPVRPNISLGRAMPGATEADLLGALEIAVGMGGEAAIIYAGKALVACDLSDLRKPPCILSPLSAQPSSSRRPTRIRSASVCTDSLRLSSALRLAAVL